MNSNQLKHEAKSLHVIYIIIQRVISLCTGSFIIFEVIIEKKKTYILLFFISFSTLVESVSAGKAIFYISQSHMYTSHAWIPTLRELPEGAVPATITRAE